MSDNTLKNLLAKVSQHVTDLEAENRELAYSISELEAVQAMLVRACKAALRHMDDKGYGGETYRLLREGVQAAKATAAGA